MAFSFVEAFNIIVKNMPEKTALCFEGQSLRYAQLAEKSARVAQKLLDTGVGRGDIVTLDMERGLDAVCAIVGVLRAGAAFCFISPEYPLERVRFIREDTGAKVMIDHSWMQSLPEAAGTLPLPAPEDPAIVVYTSGSTGRPKGVISSHRTLSLAIQGDMLSFTHEDVFLSTGSFSFVVVVVEILMPLCLGASVHVLGDSLRRDAKAMDRYIHEHGVTVGHFAPQLARLVLPRAEDQLLSLMVGSDRVYGLYSDTVSIYNFYGASETCGPVTSFKLDRLYPDITPIGRTHAGSKIYILDENLQRVPDGMEGEICISGQIADGYLNLPELTAERFIPNPYAGGEDDKILFRSNDIGFINQDGQLQYVQRRDWMLKIRGHRVEPGEIEQAMMQRAPIEQAVVTGFENALGETSLYAVYTAKGRVAPETVLEKIRDVLPPYMIPSFIEQLDSLPVNANGKVARGKIVPPDAARFQTSYEAPANEREAAICEAFAKLLSLEKVGALDDFNLLGGDSILAAKLQEELPGISPSDILSFGTPRKLAALKVEAPLAKAAPRSDWPLTFAERQMATEQGMNPESVTYNINLAFRIEGMIDADKLQAALDALLQRHAILRSYYPLINGEYTHRIENALTVPICRSACAQSEVESNIEAWNKPFELACAPLLRVNLMAHGDSYTLHLCCHHIIFDGGCSARFFDELFRLYAGEELPPVGLDYLDYAVWQSEHADYRAGEAVFKEMFADGAPENEMPTLPLRPSVLPVADIDLERTVKTAELRAAAHRLGVTQYGLLMSVLGMTLAKYCGSEDVVVGTAMSGRTMQEQEGMMGMFVNTLPIRLKPAGDMRVADFVLKTAQTIRTVKTHQTYPFERLVPMLAPDRNASRSPVFDVIFNYLHALPLPQTEGFTIRPLHIKGQALNIDLMLEAMHEGEDIRLILSYSRALYMDEVAENFLTQFVCTLERILHGGDKLSIMEAAALPGEQERQILADFAGKRTDAPGEKTLIDLFREQAARTPQKPAAVFMEKTLSYRELDANSDHLAAYLSRKGAGRGTAVGILVRRGLMMPVGALGVLKSGAAYLPLDPSYPSDRLEYMLEDAGAQIVIGDAELREKIPGFKGEYLQSDTVYTLPEGPVPAAPAPEDLFILLYTSGTTGKPKGVMLLHRNIVNFTAFYSRIHGISEADNIPAYASFGFDAHMMDMYPTLTNGACLHIIPEDMRLDLPGLKEYFDRKHISVAFMTTQLGRQFAETMRCENLRALGVGGEALVPIEPPAFALYNLYGPTECTVASNYFKVDKLYDRVPIGRAVDNTALYILDGRGQLAPVGVAGELCIAGRQVAKGYLNRPDLTEEKFVKNPFSTDPDYARMYKTGDVVRFLPGGDVDFVGRRDFQVKIRGFRVELTEIEGRIRQYPGIQDAAVIAQDDAGGGKRVVAYIVADTPVDIKALNAFIEDELPAYMVPSASMQLERIPLNQNGKVDRRSLPKIAIQAEEIVAPRTEAERAVLDVAKQILATEEIGVTTDLMYAGFNSLSSIKAAALITERTGKKLSTAQFMRERTAEKIASLLTQSEAYEARAFEQRAAYPLTPNQMGLYFACVKDPASLLYNIPFALHLGNADPERLRESVRKVIDAHPYIKTHFALEGGEPVQLRLDDAEALISLVQCTQEEFSAHKATFVRPFNFFEGPLYRVEIYRTPTQTHMLCDFHHIVFDGGSMDIFLRDLAQAYAGKAPEKESFSSFDMALMEAEDAKGETFARAKAFYHARLSDCEGATVIPTDSEGMGVPQYARAKIQKNRVEAILKGMRVTASNLFLAATALVTGRFASERSVRIASITNGREGAERQNNLGMLVKTLPIALQTTPGLSSGAYLAAVQEEMTGVLENLAYPYLQASSEYNFNAQLLYAYQGGVVSEYVIGDAPLKPELLGLDRAKFPISVNIHEDESHFIVELEYDDGLFLRSTMQTFAESIAETAGKLASSETAQIGALSILTRGQREQINSFNREIEPVRTPSLPAILESWAEKTPDADALIAADRSYSFRELNARANVLAHSLLARGVEKEDRIAFMLPRDSRILLAMFGIMKAGGCYIPIDPEYPDERIAHVLEDSGARFILTDGSRELQNGVCIDTLLENEDDTNPGIPIKGSDLAYIIYTSGSTGKPKGVMLHHRGIVNYVANTPQNRHVRALVENRCAMASVTTVSFDMFLKEAFTTLMNGLTLILADDEEAKNPDKLAALMKRTGATAFNATPSRMLQYMQLAAMKDALGQCKVVMAGGESYPPALYKKLREVTDAALINTYGPTEITVSCNAKILDGAQITIGAPLYNVVELVMDIDGNPLPPGVTGELWIGGTGVARGYFGNPEMTAERFVEKYGMRWYKSGDLARWTETGEIVILGRNDAQIKLRGLRIELGEIENCINALPEVSSSVVLVRKINGFEHLCAYYTATRELAAEELRERLLASLTRYMVPTAYLQMDALPMTPNGKIDRKALPEARLMQRESYEAPANDAEAAYCEIFREALSLEKVGATDNFFDLGGTSLLVTGLTINATERGFAISYGDVFANPTPRALAALGTTQRTDEAKPDELREYDYTEIHALLAQNSIDALRNGTYRALGNVCISGATGFLGIHVLKEYLDTQKGTAYCIVRGGRLTAEKRLKNMLVYYFSDSFDSLFGSRIVVVDGDITDPTLFEKLKGYPIDTYINCAANVKHFSAGTDIEDINVGGVVNGVAFAKEKDCRFVQISTASIAGMRIDNVPDESVRLTEQSFYFGQDLSNKYARSKFLAERIVLEAALGGLDAKIMRVGNLMARESDGEFQANFKTNNFLGRLKAYHIMGCLPYAAMGAGCEFAPIDSTARAVLLLAQTPESCRVFHPYNDHDIFMGDVVNTLQEIGVEIHPCEQEAYEQASKEAFLNSGKAKYLNSLIAYQEYGKCVAPIKSVNAYTSQALLRQGFLWPITTPQYLRSFFEKVRGLGFFDALEV